jgi:DNA excision repair protein ERCC-3
MAYNPENPIIVQSDRSVLLEVDSPHYDAARDGLAQFAELVKSPEHIHTYRLTPLSLWNAAAAGMTAEEMLDVLNRYGKYDLPENVRVDILDYVSRYGRLKLERENDELLLRSPDDILITEVQHHKEVQPFITERRDRLTLVIAPEHRGRLKQALIKIGFPVEDLAGYTPGEPFEQRLVPTTKSGKPFSLRDYQIRSIEAFHAGGSARGGSGVIVLPCGAGKTMVGVGAMEKVGAHTLIIVTNTVSVHQWRDEILDKTSIPAEAIGEYTGDKKEIKPITITTYQALTHRRSKEEEWTHLGLFTAKDWGLIVYDEVHLLPAPVFRVTAEIQARRRLGLTATLVREDGREDDVFSLIGPKKYDVPWRDLEKQGWIAPAVCHEIRVPLPDERRMEYAIAEQRDKYRIAAENPVKVDVAERLVEKHRTDRVLIIGQYIDQIEKIATHFEAPIIQGKTPVKEREKLFSAFRKGDLGLLVVSKVANFSIDLPDANVAIQVSGTYGSRQEEAQRLGRILRPKSDGGQAHFYTIVTRDTDDQKYAANRQLFLTEQGYRYTISDGLDGEHPAASVH